MKDGIIVTILNQVDKISTDFVFNGYHNLVASYSSAIVGLVILSIIIFGYMVLQGVITLSLAEVSKRALLMGFVLTVVLHWEVFAVYIYNFFAKAPNEIAMHIVQSIPGTHYSDQSSINSAMQQAWSDGMHFAAAVWERGGNFNWTPYLWSAILFLITTLMVVVALIELIVAKFGLAIYLVLAPLILPLLLFNATRQAVFDGWVRHLVTFAFIPIFVMSAIALGLLLMSTSSNDIQSVVNADKVTITEIAPYLVYSLICIGLLLKATQMASSLAGGFASSLSHHAIHTTKTIVTKATDTFKTLPRANNQTNHYRG